MRKKSTVSIKRSWFVSFPRFANDVFFFLSNRLANSLCANGFDFFSFFSLLKINNRIKAIFLRSDKVLTQSSQPTFSRPLFIFIATVICFGSTVFFPRSFTCKRDYRKWLWFYNFNVFLSPKLELELELELELIDIKRKRIMCVRVSFANKNLRIYKTHKFSYFFVAALPKQTASINTVNTVYRVPISFTFHSQLFSCSMFTFILFVANKFNLDLFGFSLFERNLLHCSVSGFYFSRFSLNAISSSANFAIAIANAFSMDELCFICVLFVFGSSFSFVLQLTEANRFEMREVYKLNAIFN